MKTTRPAGRHLDARAALDYLESRMDAPARRRVEEHLGSTCGACRDLVREMGWLVERMRDDRVPEVPEALRARALAAFEPGSVRLPRSHARPVPARLIFDSRREVVPATALRSLGQLRRLSFALGHDILELESEVETEDHRTLRGRLHASDPWLQRIELAVGRERLSTWPDAGGTFVFDRVPAGRARLVVSGPHGRYRIPPLE